MNKIEKFEQNQKLLRGMFSELDFVELLIVAKDLQSALEYRANVEELQQEAIKIANKYI